MVMACQPAGNHQLVILGLAKGQRLPFLQRKAVGPNPLRPNHQGYFECINLLHLCFLFSFLYPASGQSDGRLLLLAFKLYPQFLRQLFGHVGVADDGGQLGAVFKDACVNTGDGIG